MLFRSHVRAGAVMFIPRGVVHHYANESDPPTVALVVYAPPFEGQDREIVTGTGTERSPERNTSSGESAEPRLGKPEAASPEGGSAGAPALPDGEPAPVPGDPAGGETGSAPGASGQPEPSPGAVLEGTPPAPIPPAP